MRRPIVWIGILVALILIVILGRSLRRDRDLELAEGPSGVPWTQEAFWEDGYAERAVYRSERMVSGVKRIFETTLLTRADELDRSLQAPATEETSTRDRIPVFVLTLRRSVPTSACERHQLATVVLDREDLALRGMTTSSQECLGNHFKRATVASSRLRVTEYGYLPGEGVSEWSLAWKDRDLAEESLVLFLRALPLDRKLRLKCRILDHLLVSSNVDPQLASAEISVRGEETVEVGSDELKCVRVEVRRETELVTYWLEKEFPNVLVRMEDERGRTMTLLERDRIPL
jgi:hypothetical protein